MTLKKLGFPLAVLALVATAALSAPAVAQDDGDEALWLVGGYIVIGGVLYFLLDEDGDGDFEPVSP